MNSSEGPEKIEDLPKENMEILPTGSQRNTLEVDERLEDAAARIIARFMRMAAARVKRNAQQITVEEYLENKASVEREESDQGSEKGVEEENVLLTDLEGQEEDGAKEGKDAREANRERNVSISSLDVGREVAPRRHILDETNSGEEVERWMKKTDDKLENKPSITTNNVGTEIMEKPLNKQELVVLDTRSSGGWGSASATVDNDAQEGDNKKPYHLGRKGGPSRLDKLASPGGGTRALALEPSRGCQVGDSSFEEPSQHLHREAAEAEERPVKYVEVQKQAQEGTAVITATILPMGFKICKTLHVAKFLPGMTLVGDDEERERENAEEAERELRATGSSAPAKREGWVVIAKEIFEALGSAMGVHPQCFHIYRGQQRVRFVDALFLERDLYAEDSAKSSEPLWIDVQFPESVNVPNHLVTITPEEVLIRCVFVHPKPLDIPVPLVAEGKRRGLTHEEVIKRMYTQAEERNELPWTTVAIVHDGTGIEKPYLGGYAVKKDKSKVFLHASTQLFMKGLNYSTQVGHHSSPGVEQLSRGTQTWGVSRSCQTRRECCVMTPCKELVVDHSRDFAVIARPYFYSHQLHDLQVEKTIILQKFYRQWKARKIRRQLEMEDAEKQRRAEARQLAEEAAKLETDNREQRRRDDPRTKEDFDRLKQELMAWVNSENKKIIQNKELSDEKKRAALLALNHQELKMLQDLEDRRRIITLMGKERQFAKMFQTMSAPKLWGEVEVRTPETERAAELRALYLTLTGTPHISTRNRLDVLLHIKWTVKEFSHHALTQELCQLIDREADLLHRGRRVASLTGLRCRIEKLFKRFIEDPEFNPGMAEYTRTAVGRAKARKLYGTVYDEHNRMTVDPALQDALRRRKPVSVEAGEVRSSFRGNTRSTSKANDCGGEMIEADRKSQKDYSNKRSDDTGRSALTNAGVASFTIGT